MLKMKMRPEPTFAAKRNSLQDIWCFTELVRESEVEEPPTKMLRGGGCELVSDLGPSDLRTTFGRPSDHLRTTFGP